MPPPASKRRKTSHVSSDEELEDDASSFASFGEDVPGDGWSENGVEEGQKRDRQREASGAEDDDNDEDSDADGNQPPDGDRVGVQAEEEEEEEDDDDEDMHQSNGYVKAKGKAKHAPPAHRSSSAAVYTPGTFKSNVFKLQADELLQHLRPRHATREAAVEIALHAIKTSIDHIPAHAPASILDAERDLIQQKVAIPFPDPRPSNDAKYRLAYARPTNVNVVGSFPLKCASRAQRVLHVDMMVCMPPSIFDAKDYLNYRYFYKRAYYLACLAAGLQAAHRSEYSFRFDLLHGDPFKPILVASSAERSADAHQATPLPSPAKWCINIMPCVGEHQFLAQKLTPDKNCLRSRMKADEEREDAETLASSFYNSSLRADMLVTPYLKLLHAACKQSEAFVEACLLGETWLRQRGFASDIHNGGFGHFEWKTIMALCLQGGASGGRALLSTGYSSYQLFKATLQLLATKDFTKQPLVIGDTAEVTRLNDGTPLVWDADRNHNIMYRVQPWLYRILRYEAKTTLNTLADQLYDGFDATFISRVHDALYRFDHIVAIPLRSLKPKGSLSFSQGQMKRLFDVMIQGLGDRINQTAVMTPSVGSWDLGSSQPRYGTNGDVSIGFMVNPDTIKRTVDYGPSAETKKAAAAFRKFWGDKAELRRFKDGSILESLIWTSPQDKGQSVMEQIVRYLLHHHFELATTDEVKFFGDGFSRLVRGGVDRAVFESLMTRYKQFENDLHNLHNLPLSMRQIMPADAQLRYSSIRSPGSSQITPANVTIQLEGSGRWPDNLAATQRTKIAFLLMINDMLREATDCVDSRVGLENDGDDVLNQAYLDVTYSSEATFRIRIYHDREMTLHERRLKDKTIDPKSKEISAVGLAKYKRDYVRTPAHTQAITRLCTRFSALSGSIRLTKRWFASHLLANHIADELIELLVVRTFVQPWPWRAPSSVQTGLLRTLLWISRWDWRAEPLVVDFSAGGELKPADMQAIQTNFQAWRKLDPGMNRVALFAASNLDHSGATWTDGRPAKVVAGRMSMLAKAACAEIAEKGRHVDPASLFSSPVEDFDFVLHLSPRRHAGKFKNLDLDTKLTEHDPVGELLRDLEAAYGAAVVFFYGGMEGSVIAGLWSPLATAQRGWKVNLAYSTVPTQSGEEAQAALNKKAVLAEIARVAGDLVEKIEVFEH